MDEAVPWVQCLFGYPLTKKTNYTSLPVDTQYIILRQGQLSTEDALMESERMGSIKQSLVQSNFDVTRESRTFLIMA